MERKRAAIRARGELVYMPYLAPWSRLPLAARRLIGALVGLLILALLLFLLFRPTSSPTTDIAAAGLTATAASTGNAGAASAAATLTTVASGPAGAHTGPPRITAFDSRTTGRRHPDYLDRSRCRCGAAQQRSCPGDRFPAGEHLERINT